MPRALRPAIPPEEDQRRPAWQEQRGRGEARQGQVTATPLLGVTGGDSGMEYGTCGLVLIDHNHFLVLLVADYILLEHILLFRFGCKLMCLSM